MVIIIFLVRQPEFMCDAQVAYFFFNFSNRIDCWQFKIAVKILTCLDDVRPVYNSIVYIYCIYIFEFEFECT